MVIILYDFVDNKISNNSNRSKTFLNNAISYALNVCYTH